jgi:hypothetical protein
MSKGRPALMSDETLCSMALREQGQSPHLSEGAIMGICNLGREYMADRAKKSDEVKHARSVMAAIREKYYIELGIDGMKAGKEFNSIAYIWVTKNVLGWRDKSQDDEPKSIESPISITPEGLLTLVKSARGDSDAA